MKVKVSITYNAAKLASNLPKIIEKYSQRYARSAEKGSKANIDKGLKPKLEDSTIIMRKEAGITGTKPLYATGTFYRSIKGTSEGLEMLKYGYKHQKGFENPMNKLPNVNWLDIPARPFIGADEKAILTAFNKFRKDIRKAFKK